MEHLGFWKHPLGDGIQTTRGISGNVLNTSINSSTTHKKMLPQIVLLQKNCTWPVTLSACFPFLQEFLLRSQPHQAAYLFIVKVTGDCFAFCLYIDVTRLLAHD